MPRTKEVTIYKFDELSQKAQEHVISQHRENALDYDWYDCVYEDAKEIGLQITEFDIYRNSISGDLTFSLPETLRAIRKNHGSKNLTYKLATDYTKKLNTLRVTWRLTDTEYSIEHEMEYEAFQDLESDFRRALLQEYLTMLREECEYLESDECIKENIIANEYEFDENGEQV